MLKLINGKQIFQFIPNGKLIILGVPKFRHIIINIK